MTRFDWAVELFPWFEYYLKGIGDEPESYVQMQRNDGRWHIEETWPPEDTSVLQVSGDGGNQRVSSTSGGFEITLEISDEPIHISGLPTLHTDVSTGLCNGGQLFVTMKDAESGLRLGHATMDVRYRDGGYDSKPTASLSNYRMLMEFNPMDVIVPSGSITFQFSESGEDYIPSPCAVNGLLVNTFDLGLPLIDREENHEAWFDVPPWWEVQEM